VPGAANRVAVASRMMHHATDLISDLQPSLFSPG
jgi:hypothetical protein